MIRIQPNRNASYLFAHGEGITFRNFIVSAIMLKVFENSTFHQTPLIERPVKRIKLDLKIFDNRGQMFPLYRSNE